MNIYEVLVMWSFILVDNATLNIEQRLRVLAKSESDINELEIKRIAGEQLLEDMNDELLRPTTVKAIKWIIEEGEFEIIDVSQFEPMTKPLNKTDDIEGTIGGNDGSQKGAI